MVCTCLLAGACSDLLEEEIPRTRSDPRFYYFYYPNLSEDKIQIVEGAADYFFQEYAGFAAQELLFALYAVQVTVEEDPSLNDPGAYLDKKIRIKDVYSLAQTGNNRVLQEEIFHFYQDFFIPMELINICMLVV